ncbi:sensor histidine kinase [Variovorax ginsengisoli]|uniref:histidine kinase n=1 Tax=Variovorax ginsengisoli TaxID=363844 RepID=A0ABT9SC49_9BURK|nr:ATP-binding protein [Variovorax ginsengisoli]MDP9901915.1 nitrogen fixation/metabolism regulation signal transduction histidine kinase [Variovorax ginsengisoli]
MSTAPRDTGPAGPPRSRRARAMRWAIGVGAAAVVAIGLVLMFLLAVATNNRVLYEQNYARLFGINVVVATLLSLVIGWIAFRLVRRLRQGKFGSRLLIRLAAIFALVGVVPGVLVYVVSYQFVARSIESWFDVKVEGALDAGLNLGRATLDSLSEDLAAKTRVASSQLADIPDASAGLMLERIRDQLGATDVILWTGSAQLVASAGASRFELNPERPTQQQLRQVRADRAVAHIEGLDESAAGTGPPPASVRAIALVQRPGFDFNTEPRFLQVTWPLPTAVVANALAVQEANREYQERALARDGLRRMYIGTLTLSLFLAVFGAVLLAVLFGNALARPLLVLAEGVRQVAAGDLRPTAVLHGKDELGGLTRSFAVMTQQLADARGAVEKTVGELDAARANLQTILDNLTSGVIVLDAHGTVLSTNPGATRVLRAPLAAFEGRALAEVPGLAHFAQNIQQQFDDFEVERAQHGLDHWQHAFELHASGTGMSQDSINIVARGAELPGAARLLVFDDISEIVSAQRAQAWGEVARRLAHEIKNPLTPIQLSAERLEMKLSGKVAGPEQAILTKSVKTIVDQVDAMKRLVNEFRDYARLPAADLKPVDLNSLVADVFQLYGGEHASSMLRCELDERCPPIRGDAQQIRQVIHNLLQNAQDAAEAAVVGTGRRAEVVLRTRLGDSGQRVRLTVQDSGPGFAENILKRAFEPYVTTKTKGTGLGLAVVKKIADEHGARIELSNRIVDGSVAGAQVSLSFALAREPQGAVVHSEDPKPSVV